MDARIDVLLVRPPGGHRAERWRRSGAAMAPLGVAWLAGAVESAGASVRIIDCPAEGVGFKELGRRIGRLRPKLFGVSFTTEDRFLAFRCMRIAKRIDPGIVTVAGGPHASASADDLLRHVASVDVVVRGEGERALAALAGGEEWSGIAGVSFREGRAADGTVVHNPADAPPELDMLPPPAMHLLDRDRYRFTMAGRDGRQVRAVNVMTSRGCPFGCPYCTTPQLFGRTFRAMSLEATVAMLDRLGRDWNAKSFWFFDDTFTVNRRRVERLCEHLARRADAPAWFCEIRAESVDRELLSLMARSGCTEIGLGVETGSPALAETLRRQAALERIPDIGAWCRELNIRLHPFFICGFPGETADDLRLTYGLAERLAAMGHRPTAGVLRIYPGSAYETLARTRGLLPAGFSWSDERAGCGLVALHGPVPLWIEPDHWPELARFLAKWTRLQPISIGRRIAKALSALGSPGELRAYFSLARAWACERASR